MAQKNRETDFIETPEIGPFRYLDKEPAEEKSVNRDQKEGMGEIAVILDIKLTVEEA